MPKQPTRDEFRWEFWKESSEFWQQQTEAYKAKNQGKFTKAVLISVISFALGTVFGSRF